MLRCKLHPHVYLIFSLTHSDQQTDRRSEGGREKGTAPGERVHVCVCVYSCRLSRDNGLHQGLHPLLRFSLLCLQDRETEEQEPRGTGFSGRTHWRDAPAYVIKLLFWAQILAVFLSLMHFLVQGLLPRLPHLAPREREKEPLLFPSCDQVIV